VSKDASRKVQSRSGKPGRLFYFKQSAFGFSAKAAHDFSSQAHAPKSEERASLNALAFGSRAGHARCSGKISDARTPRCPLAWFHALDSHARNSRPQTMPAAPVGKQNPGEHAHPLRVLPRSWERERMSEGQVRVVGKS